MTLDSSYKWTLSVVGSSPADLNPHMYQPCSSWKHWKRTSILVKNLKCLLDVSGRPSEACLPIPQNTSWTWLEGVSNCAGEELRAFCRPQFPQKLVSAADPGTNHLLIVRVQCINNCTTRDKNWDKKMYLYGSIICGARLLEVLGQSPALNGC